MASSILPRSPHQGKGPEISPDQTLLQVTTLQGAVVTPLTLSLLISATYAAFALTSILWSITSPRDLTFSSLKLRFLVRLTATSILFPPSFSILNSTLKVVVRNDIACSRAHQLGSSEFSTIWLKVNCHSH